MEKPTLSDHQTELDRRGDATLLATVRAITGSSASGAALAFALEDFVQRLRERTREAEQDARAAVRNAAKAWFALPADQRHPHGPEFTPDGT